MLLDNFRAYLETISPLTTYVLTALLVLAIYLLFRLYQRRYRYVKQPHLCTHPEQIFLNKLHKIIPNEWMIHCQVSLIALLKPLDFRSARMVWAKRMDYVITDKDSQTLLVIELDDASHNQPERIKRDKFLNKVLKGKHPLLRITSEEAKNMKLVRKKIELSLNL